LNGLVTVLLGLILGSDWPNTSFKAPFMITLVLFAAFQSTHGGDIIIAILIGVFAYYMPRFGYPRPALMIGFVLASGLETNFYQTVEFYSWSVFQRPIFLTLICISLISLYAGFKLLKK